MAGSYAVPAIVEFLKNTPGAAPPLPLVSVALADIAREYAGEWFDEPCAGKEQNICVEPDDGEAETLPGWHPAEEASGYDDEAPRPFRLFVVRARVEVEWSTREVAAFNT